MIFNSKPIASRAWGMIMENQGAKHKHMLGFSVPELALLQKTSGTARKSRQKVARVALGRAQGEIRRSKNIQNHKHML